MKDILIPTDNLEALISDLKAYKELLWINPSKKTFHEAIANLNSEFTNLPTLDNIHEADLRLRRFAPLFQLLFPETILKAGLIESDLVKVENFIPNQI